jgi:tetratricopeptide (TPR) repeat protein
MKKLLFAILLFTSVYAKNNGRVDSLILAGINQIYSIKFEEAYSTFDKLREVDPHNPAGKFFDAMVTWWQILLDLNNTRFDGLFYNKLEDVIDQCDSILDEDKNNYNALFYKGGALGFRGRLLSVREDWVDAALDGKDALPIVGKIAELYPEKYDIQLGLGIYNYYAAIIPEKFSFVKPLMYLFPPGNRELGLTQLKIAAEKGHYAKYETRYFLTMIYFDFEKDYSLSMKYCKQLLKDFPQNPRFENFLARIYFRTAQFEKADSVFKIIYTKIKAGQRGYNYSLKRSTLYYLADINARHQRNTEAIEQFKESLKISEDIDGKRDSGFKVNTALYLGILYTRIKDYEKAREYYKRVLEMDEYLGSIKKAEKALSALEKLK